GRVVLSGTERGNVEVEVHPDFGIIATANPNYVGTVELGRAMERRFGRGLGVIEMDYLPPDEEADAIAHELAREPLFARHGITFSLGICQDVAQLAASLRGDPRVGETMRSRVSTRTLVNWLGLAQITGRPLATVFARAFLGTVPAEAREQALRLAREALGDRCLDPGATARLATERVRWPTLTADTAAPLAAARPPEAPRERSAARMNGHAQPVIHRVRFVRPLSDGGKVLIAEPLHADHTHRFGLGVRIRAYDATGHQIRDPDRLATIRRMIQDDDGLNVLQPLGRRPAEPELLPCLTPRAVEALELAEAALLLGRPVFLAGPTGAGKSSLARTLAYLRGTPLVELGFTGETAKTDLSAVRRLIGGVTAWQTQAFLEALEAGDTVIANEYNLAYPDVHSLLNGLFDKGARFVFPDGRVCRVHPQGRVIATGLLDGPGVKPLNEAVENRFGAIIGIDYPPVDEEVALLRHVAPNLDPATIGRCVRLVDYCRRLVAGKVDAATLADLTRPAQQALRQAARRAALSTAELVALARFANGSDFAERLREGILDGAPESVRRVIEPVLLQYGIG
ncbi:MAG TPA: AAA family ATPase, partial [Chloroflexota bacterium]|nr:AAA family ATPase [Chloroflexota bacterium]